MNTVILFLTWCNFLQTDRMESEFFALMVWIPFVGGRIFGINTSEQVCRFDFIKCHLVWVMFDGLLLCTERPWFITFFFLVGKWHMIHCYMMPSQYLALFLLTMVGESAVCWMAVLGDLAGVDPGAWGCLAGVLAARPWCHFQQNANMSFIRKLKIFYNKIKDAD